MRIFSHAAYLFKSFGIQGGQGRFRKNGLAIALNHTLTVLLQVPLPWGNLPWPCCPICCLLFTKREKNSPHNCAGVIKGIHRCKDWLKIHLYFEWSSPLKQYNTRACAISRHTSTAVTAACDLIPIALSFVLYCLHNVVPYLHTTYNCLLPLVLIRNTDVAKWCFLTTTLSGV